MKKIGLILIFFFLSYACTKKSNLPVFIDKQFTILDTLPGYLNEDSIRDLILILKRKQELPLKTGEDFSPRPMLILLGITERQFELANKNDSIVLCANCGGMVGDAYSKVTIDNHCFTIYSEGGSCLKWENYVTFCYSDSLHNWVFKEYYFKSYIPDDFETIDTVIRITDNDVGIVFFEDYNSYR